jgi:hypothetical protein
MSIAQWLSAAGRASSFLTVPASDSQVVEDGADAAVVAVGRRQAQFAEDAADVLFHRGLGDRQRHRDGGVWNALVSSAQDVVLPGSVRRSPRGSDRWRTSG